MKATHKPKAGAALKERGRPAIAEPITITLPGNLSAAIRFYALIYGQIPEEFALTCIIEDVRGATEANNLCMESEHHLTAWLGRDAR
jgi:hypothetical protein